MSTSMTGFAASPGTDVLPTCSMPITGTLELARLRAYSARNSPNLVGQIGSYSTTWITTAIYEIDSCE
jgi:hypothetical protein